MRRKELAQSTKEKAPNEEAATNKKPLYKAQEWVRQRADLHARAADLREITQVQYTS
jgi:hypothetical protein